MRLTFLGTGDPLGMPVIGCSCKHCKSSKRLRPSILVKTGNHNIIFDISPDARQQMLAAGCKPSAFFVTHAHFDHFFGIGELFQLFYLDEKPDFEIFMNKSTCNYFSTTFPWMKLPVKPLRYGTKYSFGNAQITPFIVEHSSVMETSGFIIEEGNKKVVYMPDFKRVPNSADMEMIKGADLLITDGQYVFGKYMEDDDHLNGTELLSFIDYVKPKKIFLMAVSEHFYKKSHEDMQKNLPGNIFIAKDMQRLEI